MKLDSLSSIQEVAKFLGTQEMTVTRLLDEGRLGGVLVANLQRRGVAATPRVKNSIELVLRGLRPPAMIVGQESERSYLLSSDATATIMFTDIVGSTDITGRLGNHRSRALFRHHNEVIRRHTRENGGVEVKSMGDGFMLTFTSARRALSCAVAAQKEFHLLNSQHPEAHLMVRMGMSVGEPIREEEDLFGMSVIQAARISAQAEGSQILTCHIVYSLVSRDGEFEFNKLGAFELKGISEPQVLYEVFWRQS